MDADHPAAVHSDPDKMGGTPVFVDSRLPVVVVLSSLDAGASFESLVKSWPWLTPQHIQAARDWVAVHPDNEVRP